MGATAPLHNVLIELNTLLISAVLIVAFSLLAYLALQNLHTSIARALCVLLTGVVVVAGGDVLLSVPPVNDSTIQFLLRAQWLGIVCVPAGYVHLSYALLSYTDSPKVPRPALVPLAYALSGGFLLLALGTDWLVGDGITRGPLAQFSAGPLFWLFSLFFGLASLGGLLTVVHVRRNALTPTLRRRLTYLGATFLAPGMAVFPYLVVAGALSNSDSPLSTAMLVFLAFGNAVVAAMIVVMVYSIAFQGLLMPDRLIKQDFIRWGLYGPFVGITIVLFLRIVPALGDMLGLPDEILITFGIMVMTVLMPILVSKVRPYLDALVFAQDQEEISYLRALPRNTFTYADLRSLLENTLLVICGALRIDTGFVAAPDDERGYTIKSLVGSRRMVKQFVNEHPLSELMPRIAEAAARGDNTGIPPVEAFVQCNGFCMLPLRSPDGDFLGAVGVATSQSGFSNEARRLIGAVAHQMEMALSTVHMQQRLFDTLRDMGPEMRSLQELNSRLEQATPAALETLEAEVALLPEFPQLVKDALTHYWGGPKLSDSPLLNLRTVRRMINEPGSSPTRALQAVLRRAIENLRPEEQLDPSAQEWILYNILELRFLQGKRARDAAERLAMSESDLYRKQRIAIEEVARQLALMEEAEPKA
ncbi:MAG TPA: hypothetical protein VFS21_32050 [Roseiflexaceae bacterium]|nr:hypothetical protein [Roseiflexaceae bacterium]